MRAADVPTGVTLFVQSLRAGGMKVDLGRVSTCVDALSRIDWPHRDALYWAMRVTLCSGPDDLSIFDSLFDTWFGDFGDVAPQRAEGTAEGVVAAGGSTSDSGDRHALAELQPMPAPMRASAEELLRVRDVAGLSDTERATLNAMVARLTPRTTPRPGRRFTAHRRGEIDLARTVRQIQRDAGEVRSVHYRRRRPLRRRLVLLVDISGSMDWYADLLLRFSHAAVRAGPAETEVFTIGTRLSRVTREFQTADVADALVAADAHVVDWHGGTRIGQALRSLFAGPARACVRGAVVVVATDGLEPGQADVLEHQLIRLNRVAHTVIWCNPHADLAPSAVRTRAARVLAAQTSAETDGHTCTGLNDLCDIIAMH